MSQPTPQQEAAIAARGDVLVVAGAGAGKTRTLVDRCLAWLLEGQNHSLDQILMVTFTEAAAAEMRRRLRAQLENIAAATPSAHVTEQLALLETAWICTLHSFCFHLVREHFHTLGLDPQLIVLPEERARLLERQALDAVLQTNYSRETPAAKAIQETIQSQGGDSDLAVRELVMRLHHYTQTLRDPAAWFEAQTARFESTGPDQWREWLMAELKGRRDAWLPWLRAQPAENKAAGLCAVALASLPAKPSRAEFAAALETISQAESMGKPIWRKPLETLFSEARFLHTVGASEKEDPLVEDWTWSAPSMLALLDLTRQFGETYRASKRDAGGIDFHDLEQYALRLLWESGQPSTVAEQWRAKLGLIFVDEFQDINHAQEAIIQALGREGAEANRFLVGDVKQSIYRFRLADPRIFLKYQKEWRTRAGARVISLADNFRSHEGILNFVNAVFASLMRAELGGIQYDDEARLRFGNREERGAMSDSGNEAPRVELHLRRVGRQHEEDDSGDTAESATVSDTEMEARLVGQRLIELRGREITIPGQPARVASWADMVILMRSPRHKVEAYVKEFARLGVPLTAVRGGFYESLEVRDLLNLLQILDNPSQDLPLLAVLRSPLAGLTADELAAIRLAERPGRYWAALLRWHREHPEHECVNTFLQRYRAWRRLSRLAGVSQLLERVEEETGYAEFQDTPEGAANISRLMSLTLQFDRFRGEGLYRFLQFVEAQQENELDVEPAGRPLRDAVRLMSIHQSKGLEFPMVALADLGKRFNLDDARGRVILDEEFGLCPQVKPPGLRQFYPSLPHWLAQRRQKRETYGEELRLLYVAMTRAADRLLLFGTARETTISLKWSRAAAAGLGTTEILSGVSFMDWLGPWMLQKFGAESLEQSGENSLLTWKIVEQAAAAPLCNGASDSPPAEVNGEILRKGRMLAEWRYPFAKHTQQVAKTSVSALRRSMAEEDDEETQPLFSRPSHAREKREAGKMSAADIGSAHHAFLEAVSLTEVGGVTRLQAEAARLRRQRRLTEAQTACLDFDALAAFWDSEVGRQWLERREHIRRELPFTARFSPSEFGNLQKPEDASNAKSPQSAVEEFIIVQGVIDMAAVMPGEIWVLDFKTDHFAREELAAKIALYRSQLTIYAQAITRIYVRPVTRKWLHFLAIGETMELDEGA